MIIAHRGASKEAPENTIPAFEMAWKHQADGIEGDFQLTSDGYVVCIHDRDTARVAGSRLVIKDSTLADLRQLDVGSYRGEPFNGATIPTLNEVLATVPEGKRAYLEIKSGVETIPPLLAVLEQSGCDPSQITVISFDKDVVRTVKLVQPTLKAYLLWSVTRDDRGELTPSTDTVLKTLKSIGADGVSTSAGDIDLDYISTIRQVGYEYHVWTVDDPALAATLNEWGVDSITTNVPKKIREQLT